MRVVHFLMGRCNPESANGIDKAVFHLSRAQAGLGADVAVLSISDKEAFPIPGVDARTYPPRLPRLPLPPRLTDIAVNRSPFNLPPSLTGDLLAFEPDLVHLHFVHLPVSIRLARQVTAAHVPYCVSTHGGLTGDALNRRARGKLLFAALFERRHLEQAAFVHAVSRLDADSLAAYGAQAATVVIAPNCIDLADVPAGIGSDRPEGTGRGPGAGLVVVFLGRLDPEQKGLDLLVRGLAAATSPVRLVLAGPDWRGGRSRLEGLARELGVGDRVSFVGTVLGREKWELVASADVFAHPSRWEAGVPFAVLEAMAVGRPLLLTENADPEGLAVRAGAAVGVDLEPQSIAGGLDALAAMDAGERAAMGSAARGLVARAFSWERTARTLLDAYEDVIDGRRPRHAAPAT